MARKLRAAFMKRNKESARQPQQQHTEGRRVEAKRLKGGAASANDGAEPDIAAMAG